jgi:hypothetical protein
MINGNGVDIDQASKHDAELAVRSSEGPAMTIVDVVVKSSDR